MRHSNQTIDRILVVLPFWDGDKAMAMQLARLLADMEVEKSGANDVVFMARRDCKHDRETVGYVSRKFNTYTANTTRPETGWPAGCNAQFFSAVDWCLRGISSAKIPRYKAILILAADVAPLVNDGLLYLHSQWDALSKRGVKVAGAMVPGNARNPEGSHINGDCFLMSGELDFLYWLAKRAGGVRGGGWDYSLAPEFALKGWADIPGIKSHYRRPSFTEDEWPGHVEAGIKWLHGIKDDSLLKISRRKLL